MKNVQDPMLIRELAAFWLREYKSWLGKGDSLFVNTKQAAYGIYLWKNILKKKCKWSQFNSDERSEVARAFWDKYAQPIRLTKEDRS